VNQIVTRNLLPDHGTRATRHGDALRCGAMARRPDAYYRVFGTLGNSRVVTRLHPVAYRLTGGRWLIGRNLLLNVVLTTTGRQSGRTRDAPLLAVEDGERLIVVGSKNGADVEPGWVWNLRAQPEALVRVGREVREVRAHEAEGEERERLWRLAAEAYPGYDLYQRKTTRRLPVVVLEPREAG
jgi:deazaflavin-dependent oxidoreductase (nitroreductase family)